MEKISNKKYSFREGGVGATFTRLQAWESLAKPSAHGVLVGVARGNKPYTNSSALAWNRCAGGPMTTR